MRGIEVVAFGEHLQAVVREDRRRAFGHLAVIVRVAQAAKDKEHRLAEGFQPGTAEVVGFERLDEGFLTSQLVVAFQQ